MLDMALNVLLTTRFYACGWRAIGDCMRMLKSNAVLFRKMSGEA